MRRSNFPEFLEFALDDGKLVIGGTGFFRQFKLFNRAVQVAAQGVAIGQRVMLVLPLAQRRAGACLQVIQAWVVGVEGDLIVEHEWFQSGVCRQGCRQGLIYCQN